MKGVGPVKTTASGYRSKVNLRTERTNGRKHFAAWSAAALIPIIAVAVGFLVVLALVIAQWTPLTEFDSAVVDAVNDAVQDKPLVVQALNIVTILGDSLTAWIVFSTATVWLLIRREIDLAIFVVVAALGAAALTYGTKALVERVRPVVEVPIATSGGHSFPSGHTLTATTMIGVLLLVFLPLIRASWRRVTVWIGVFIVVAVGLSRIALGVHFPSDVLGGWLMGLLWLFVTASAFRHWEESAPRRGNVTRTGLAPGDRQSAEFAPSHDRPLPRGWRSVAELIVVVVLIWGSLVGVGLLIKKSALFMTFDNAVINWFGDIRDEPWSSLAVVLGRIGSTPVIIGVLAVAFAVTLAITKRWRPSIFLLFATAGESALFLASSEVVGRARPPLDNLGVSQGPSGGSANAWSLTTSSFPSGHVAATVATYGAISLLCLVGSKGKIRYAAPAITAILVLVVASSRLYRGVHYPTDVIASVVYASCWLTACWLILRPMSRSAQSDEQRQEGR